MRSILLQQPGVVDAGADWQGGTGWVIYDPSQVQVDKLVAALSTYYPSQLTGDQPYTQ